jgi:hypothetical protein
MLVLLLSLPCMWWSDVFITKLHINLFRSRMEKKANSKAFGVDYTHWGTWEYHLRRSMCYVFNFKSTKNLQECFIEGKWWLGVTAIPLFNRSRRHCRHFKTRE